MLLPWLSPGVAMIGYVIKTNPKDTCHAAIGKCLNHTITLRTMHVLGYCQICPILYLEFLQVSLEPGQVCQENNM